MKLNGLYWTLFIYIIDLFPVCVLDVLQNNYNALNYAVAVFIFSYGFPEK